jgi:nicotinamide phosphoribosyltransferase
MLIDSTNTQNLILATDSYKLNHWKQYPKGTEKVYSYFESRKGAQFDYTVFFGLQYLLKKYLEGPAISWDDLSEAQEVARNHFGDTGMINYEGWAYIMTEHAGKLPLRIKAVPEGLRIPTGNILMSVENTDPKCFWLTNALESMLTHVWYPSTVATLSNWTVEMIGRYLDETAHDRSALPFMLHDFGYRGASSHESAGIGGAAHLINSMGTDTLPSLLVAKKYYDASLDGLGLSVPATEHSVMTALGRNGESEIVSNLIEDYPTGILSVVADSYDIYEFVRALGSTFHDRIMQREGVFVVRPDSVTPDLNTPAKLVLWIMNQLAHDFGTTSNEKGYRILDPHVRVLWGDGIDPKGIELILRVLEQNSYSAENMVFGMGGGLLQKVNRDTQRFAFKASAIKIDGQWHDVYKEPLDHSKTSKRGTLKLTHIDGEGYTTVTPRTGSCEYDVLEDVFSDGEIVGWKSFDSVRKNAGLLLQ